MKFSLKDMELLNQSFLGVSRADVDKVAKELSQRPKKGVTGRKNGQNTLSFGESNTGGANG